MPWLHKLLPLKYELAIDYGPKENQKFQRFRSGIWRCRCWSKNNFLNMVIGHLWTPWVFTFSVGFFPVQKINSFRFQFVTSPAVLKRWFYDPLWNSDNLACPMLEKASFHAARDSAGMLQQAQAGTSKYINCLGQIPCKSTFRESLLLWETATNLTSVSS